MWQPTHKLNFSCPAVGEPSRRFFLCGSVWLCIPIAVYSRKRNRERKRKNWALAILFTARDFDICCLVRGRLNKFKVKPTAAFSHIAAWGGNHCWETVLILFRIQMNLEGTLLYEWRKQREPRQTDSQPRRDGKTKEKARWMEMYIRNLTNAKLHDLTVWLILDILKHWMQIWYGLCMGDGGSVQSWASIFDSISHTML